MAQGATASGAPENGGGRAVGTSRTGGTDGGSNGKSNSKGGLNDVMIAMDVVDTLRHDERIALQELDNEGRRADLIKRLRKIYQDQGIEVSDRMLEEGVKALEESRFSYDPPPDDWRRKLAEIYVTRMDWGRWVLGALAGILFVWGAWYMVYERPRAIAIEQQRVELAETLPRQIKSSAANIATEAKDPEVVAAARQIEKDGLAAALRGDAPAARKSAKTLREMLSELREDYAIKIVTRKGQLSGLWRIPKVNPGARNYYLIVEAVRGDGSVVPKTIVNEETGKRERVKTWALRVPKSVLDAVQLDKSDDGIIQNATVGVKKRGLLKPDWNVEVTGGALSRW